MFVNSRCLVRVRYVRSNGRLYVTTKQKENLEPLTRFYSDKTINPDIYFIC